MSEMSPFVLVHGAWHGPWCWDDVAADLRSRGREVHAITLPFHDQPGDRTRIWSTVRSYVAKVADIVGELDRPPILVGHSMGGYVVQRHLETRSSTVAGAVLVASVPRRGVGLLTARMLRRQPADTLRAIATLDLWPVVAGGGPADLFLGPHAPPEAVELLDAKLQNESFAAYVAMVLRWPRPQRITAPTSVVAGEHDAIFTLAEQRDLAAALRTELAVLPGAGHDLMLDTSAGALAEHLATWDPSAT